MTKFLPVLGAMLVILIGLFSNRIVSPPNQYRANAISDAFDDRKKTYTIELANGLDYRLGAYPKIRLLHFDGCRIEKRKYSGFSFGAFNILVIDRLEIILPPLAKQVPNEGAGRDEVASRKQGEKTFQKFLAQYPHFSGVRVNDLSVGVANLPTGNGEDGIEEILTARRAETGTKGVLKLVDCEFLTESGERVRCRNAELSLEPPFLLSTKHRTFRVAKFSERKGIGFLDLILK